MLGRYGDTHVAPEDLFDPAATDTDTDTDAGRGVVVGPPGEAMDVQLRCPVSLSMLLEGMARAGLEAELGAWRDGFAELAERMARQVQHAGGYVADGDRRDLAPARLAVTAVVDEAIIRGAVIGGAKVDERAPVIVTARWHVHVYLGPTAASLIDGRVWPVDYEQVRGAVWDVVHPAFVRGLQELAVEQLGVTWGEPRPGALAEVIDPPWHEHIDTPDRGTCPGRWGPRRLLLADERSLRLAAQEEHWLAAARAQGREWTEPALYEPPE